MIKIMVGHVLSKLRELPDECVHCVVSSPPYYGLRDYKIEPQVWPDGWRGSLGLEPTLDLYLDHMVEVCREIRRVLRKDGIFWCNIGDSYATTQSSRLGGKRGERGTDDRTFRSIGMNTVGTGPYKPKDLLLVPHRLALRLQEDGWWVRSDIIFAKRAPMPESARDRPTSAHEHIFLLTKNPRYFFDGIALSQTIADDEAVPEWYNAVHEDLHQMPDRKARRSIPSGEEREERPVLAMSGMLGGAHAGVASDSSRTTVFDRNGSSLQRIRGGEGQAFGIPENPKPQGYTEGLGTERGRKGECGSASEVGEAESGATAVLREWERSSCNRALPANTEGSSLIGAGRSQAPRQNADKEHCSGERMGNHQGPRGEQMSLLPPCDAATDNGSCDPDQQGGASRRIEHRPGVPELQREEKQQGDASALVNARNVWWLSPSPYPGAHFAVFSPELPRRCIMAGTSDRGVCPKCGAPWMRVVEKKFTPQTDVSAERGMRMGGQADPSNQWAGFPRGSNESETIGWRPTCSCDAGAPVPATVLDPFLGSGTTAMVADQLQRHCIGIELSPTYAEMAERRIRDDNSLFAEIAAE